MNCDVDIYLYYYDEDSYDWYEVSSGSTVFEWLSYIIFGEFTITHIETSDYSTYDLPTYQKLKWVGSQEYSNTIEDEF